MTLSCAHLSPSLPAFYAGTLDGTLNLTVRGVLARLAFETDLYPTIAGFGRKEEVLIDG